MDAKPDVRHHRGVGAMAKGGGIVSEAPRWLRQAATANNMFVRSRLHCGPRLAAARGIVAGRTTRR